MKAIVAILVLSASVFVLPISQASVVSSKPDPPHSTRIDIFGEVGTADVDQVRTAIAAHNATVKAPPAGFTNIYVRLNSRGGDVRSAMLIGQIIRANAAATMVLENHECVSACVFILASGVTRVVLGRVGIHRPYAVKSQGRTFEEASKQFDALRQEAKTYLSRMGISDSLYDDMLRVRPETIRYLSEPQLESYGLQGEDAAHADVNDSEWAA